MIGMVLPQGMWAGVTIDTSTPGKVIVTSENAGDFATYLNYANADQLNALKVNEIVFVGKFNETDLSTLQAKNCATQKKVDMAEAKFIKSASSSGSNYLLYHSSTPSSGQKGQHCIVGATKYISAKSNTWTLTEINEDQLGNGQSWNEKNVLADDASTITDYNYEAYVKLPTTLNYYKYNSSNNSFELIENPTEEQISSATAAPDECSSSNIGNFGHLGQSGQSIIKVRPADGTYRFFKSEAPFVWDTAANLHQNDYSDGDTVDPSLYYSSIDLADAPTDHGQNVYAGGVEYIYNNNQWVPASEFSSGNEEYDYTQMKFDYWGSNVEEIITSNYATGAMAQQLCNNCSNLKTLTLSAGDFTGSVLGNNITHLETVNIQNQVKALGSGMFNKAGKEGTGNDATQHLTTVTFQDGCQIKTLPGEVFAETGVTSISIPSSVELIETNAFQACQSLETVTFVNTNKNPLVIKNKAFQQSDHIKDIYLNVNPKDRLLICEYNAFDYHSMEGQTAEGSEMATLHFAEKNFDYYAGEWKKGMAFSQSELNAFKDGIEIKDENEQVKYAKPNTQDPTAWGDNGFGAIESYGDEVDGYYHNPKGGNTKYAPANGWQQFAKTASDREIEIIGNVYMTYSTDTPYSLPKGIVAFRVTDYKYAVKNAKGYDTNGTLILKAIDQVPTETGMLLISTSDYVIKTSDVNANPNVQSVFYFGDPDGEPAKYHYTMGEAGDPTSNYLAPAVHGIAVGPVSQDNPDAKTGAINVNGRPFTHRNFAMHKTSHQFVRLTHCTMPDNRAFLSLPITKFDNPDEGPEEGPTPTQTLAGKDISLYDGYDHPYTTEAGAKASLVFDYDVEQYGMIWPLIKDDSLTGVTTGIKNVNVETVQEGIYTLQGVKVSAPSTKGIYIVNGKKVIIK
jgi:hypothetical protein